MMSESTRYIAGQEIKPGARILHPGNLSSVVPQVFAVCDAVRPDRWHGEVTVLGRTVLKTEAHDTNDQAARAAQQQFVDKLVQLLTE